MAIDETFLVTGAHGCIGAWVVRRLAAEGTPVVALDASDDDHRLRQVLDPEQLEAVARVRADITELEALERVLDEHGVTHVIHLAALQVPFCRADPPLGARVNVVGTVNVFEAVARRGEGGAAPVVYASSIAAYDALEEGAEPAMEGVPSTLYGVYKRANEGTATVFAAERGVPSVGLRPHTVYGVARDQGLTSAPTTAMLAAAAGRDYDVPFGGRYQLQHAADAARDFVLAARSDCAGRAGAQPAGPGGGDRRDHRRDRGRGARDGRPAQLLRRGAPVSGHGRRGRPGSAARTARRHAAGGRDRGDDRALPRAAGARARAAARMSGVPTLLCDVGPRDGLQNDPAILPPATRAELCRRLAAAGLPRVEAASFVHPKLVPQMAGAEDVLGALDETDGVRWSALVLNRRGLERALGAGAREVHAAYPVSDTFAQRNQNMTAEEGAATTEAIIAAAHAAGARATATLGTAFGCPFEGAIDPGRVVEHAGRMAAAGADEIMLADTIGAGVPAQVRRLVPDARAAAGDTPVGLHLHNTRNTGFANAYAGLEHGVTLFDASVGGLGGCPFAPRATGNIATEDLVYLLEGEGVATGVDLDALIGVAEWLGGVLGRELPGLVHRAGGFPQAVEHA